MNIQRIHGYFTAKDAIDILTKMIHIKIKYHESRIGKSNNDEDIKMPEDRIKLLQKDLANAKKYIELNGGEIAVNSESFT